MKIQLALIVPAFFVVGCAHHRIALNAPHELRSSAPAPSKKIVAYVMTEDERQISVATDAGGGEKVTYFPYRDLETTIRQALRSDYQDVYVISSATDAESIKKSNASLIFVPEISTSSSSSSWLTWPPTEFTIEATFNVTTASGSPVKTLKLTAKGAAQSKEWNGNFNLAATRAASQLGAELRKEAAEIR